MSSLKLNCLFRLTYDELFFGIDYENYSVFLSLSNILN
jgi:hypothetical protein